MAARKTEANKSWQDKLKAWWETDTAKAVATIIAVLLIPASVIAWNYATTQGEDIRNSLDTDTSSTSNDNESENTEENAMETESNEEGSEMAQDTEGSQDAQGQESANATSTNETEDNNSAVGGMGSVETLPNTDSTESYTVQKGDNVYRISMKVCGNDSFYRSNKNMDYLKVGQTLNVNCN